jgi:hypothetical protein
MSVADKNTILHHHFLARGITLKLWEVNALRRAQHTLHTWDELQCGDSNDVCSLMIERDEDTGIPYRVTTIRESGMTFRSRIADREKFALRQVAAICTANGLSYYHQSDCRGCSLYIGKELLTSSTYPNGVACAV